MTDAPTLYRDRNRIERFFNRIKQCRRVATRYDKLAANYLAFVQLASIRLWLRAYKFNALSNSLGVGAVHEATSNLGFDEISDR